MKSGALWVRCWRLVHSWLIMSAIGAAARAGKRGEFLFFYCQVSNARFHQFPVGQISRNLHTTRGSVDWGRMNSEATHSCRWIRSVGGDPVLCRTCTVCGAYAWSKYQLSLTHATRYITANVLQTKVDAQRDKLSTELSWQSLQRSTLSSYSELFVESRQFWLTSPAFGAFVGGDPVWVLLKSSATEN